MKRMPLLVLFVICFVALAGYSSGQEKPAKFIEMVTVQVRPNAVEEYEDFIKKILAAAKKVGMTQMVGGGQIILGGEGETYVFALPFDQWGEMDKWSRVPKILSEAYGEEEAAKILKAGRAGMTHSKTAVYSLMNDFITHPSKMPGSPPAYYTVTFTEVKPDMHRTYRHLISRYKAAEEKESGTSFAVRRVSVVGPVGVYVTSRPFNQFADTDKRPGGLMVKAYGEEEAMRIGDGIMSCVKHRETFIIAVRPDLSYAPSKQTTNE